MYDDRYHISNKRLLITLGLVIALVAVLVAVTSAVLGAVLGPAERFGVADPERTESSISALVTESAPAATLTESTGTAQSLLSTQPAFPATEPTPSAGPVPAEPLGATVVIDAGHQRKADPDLEPIGPGASERKPKVSGGSRGVATGNPEGEITLAVAIRLRDQLERRGVKVIMVRTKQAVNISNSKRAKIANEADANLFVRLHCDGAGSQSTNGITTLVPGKNRWTAPIVKKSAIAGRQVHDAVVSVTGAKDRGVRERTDLSGFNWCEVPTVLVEMGFLTNPAEDRKLASDEYQDRLAEGMARGIVKYLKSE